LTDLECGGRAERRHRFSHVRQPPKAAWRYASRRSPKLSCRAIRVSSLSVFIRVIRGKNPLQNREQDRRQPTGPAKVLLTIATLHPKVLLEVA
jgi:hypothetical protein